MLCAPTGMEKLSPMSRIVWYSALPCEDRSVPATTGTTAPGPLRGTETVICGAICGTLRKSSIVTYPTLNSFDAPLVQLVKSWPTVEYFFEAKSYAFDVRRKSPLVERLKFVRSPSL